MDGRVWDWGAIGKIKCEMKLNSALLHYKIFHENKYYNKIISDAIILSAPFPVHLFHFEL